MNAGDILIIPANPDALRPETYQTVKSFDADTVVFDVVTTFETYNSDGTLRSSETRHGESTMPRAEADALTVQI